MGKVFVLRKKDKKVSELSAQDGRFSVKWPHKKRKEYFKSLRSARRKLARKGFTEVFNNNPKDQS